MLALLFELLALLAMDTDDDRALGSPLLSLDSAGLSVGVVAAAAAPAAVEAGGEAAGVGVSGTVVSR